MCTARSTNSTVQREREDEQSRPAEGDRGDAGDPDLSAERLLLAHEAHEQERHPHGGDGEEVVAHAQRRHAHDEPHRSRHRRGRHQRQHQRHSRLRQQRRRVGAHPVERGVTEAHLPAEPGDDVEREREQDRDGHGGEDRDFVGHRVIPSRAGRAGGPSAPGSGTRTRWRRDRAGGRHRWCRSSRSPPAPARPPGSRAPSRGLRAR